MTVTANPQTKVYGTADPTLTDTATGFVDTTVDGVTIDDTAATALTGHLARTPGETVSGGPYAITQGTLAAEQLHDHLHRQHADHHPGDAHDRGRARDQGLRLGGPDVGLHLQRLPILGYRRDGPHRLARAGGRRDGLGRSLRDQPGNARGRQQLHDPASPAAP